MLIIGNCGVRRRGEIWELSVLSAQLCSETKTNLNEGGRAQLSKITIMTEQ